MSQGSLTFAPKHWGHVTLVFELALCYIIEVLDTVYGY